MSKSSSTYNPETILGRLRGGSGDNTAADAHPRYTSQPQSRPHPQTKRARAFGADEDEELTCLRRHCEQLRDLLVRRVGTPHTESDNAYVRELEMAVETLQRENEWLAASLGNSRDASAAASASASTLPAPPAPPSRDSSSSVHHLRAGVKSARGRNGSMPWIHPDSRQGETAPPFIATSRRGSLFRDNLIDGSSFHVKNTAYRHDISTRAMLMGNRTSHPQVVHIPANVRALGAGNDPSTKPRLVVDLK